MSVLIALMALSGNALSGAAPAVMPAAKSPQTSDARPMCQDLRVRSAGVRRASATHRLGDEPNADMVLTVLRTVDGCSPTVKVREDVGAH